MRPWNWFSKSEDWQRGYENRGTPGCSRFDDGYDYERGWDQAEYDDCREREEEEAREREEDHRQFLREQERQDCAQREAEEAYWEDIAREREEPAREEEERARQQQ